MTNERSKALALAAAILGISRATLITRLIDSGLSVILSPPKELAAMVTYYAAHRAERLAYARANRAEQLAYQREYRKTDAGYASMRADGNRAHARRRGAILDLELTGAILSQILRDRDNCDWCATPTLLHDRIIDHRVAICFGGKHAESNIQILCQGCDKLKSNAERSLASKLRNGATRSDFVLAA